MHHDADGRWAKDAKPVFFFFLLGGFTVTPPNKTAIFRCSAGQPPAAPRGRLGKASTSWTRRDKDGVCCPAKHREGYRLACWG